MSAEPSARYEIVVKDRLSDRFGQAFPGVDITTEPGRTVLTGEFRDQSTIYCFHDRLQDFGIELVSVNAID